MDRQAEMKMYADKLMLMLAEDLEEMKAEDERAYKEMKEAEAEFNQYDNLKSSQEDYNRTYKRMWSTWEYAKDAEDVRDSIESMLKALKDIENWAWVCKNSKVDGYGW